MDLYKNVARWLLRLFIGASGAALICGASEAAALAPLQQQGLTWLSAQVDTNGTLLREPASIARPLQTREESLLTLCAMSTAPGALISAVAANSDGDVEAIARRILAASASGQSASSDAALLLDRQNTDGGWSLTPGYQSDATDTALALQALAAAKASPTAATAAAAFLSGSVLKDGGWGVSDSSVYATANVLLAANAWSGQISSMQTISAAATTWLLGARNSTLAYGDAFDNAVALLGLATQADQSASLQPLMAALIAAELNDGSWADDPYVTAMALRAIWLASQVPIVPTAGDISGTIIDQSNSSPLSGVAITLTENAGISATTGSDGTFRLSNIPAATYTLVLSRSGYQTRSLDVEVVAGQLLKTGSIGLTPISTTATLSGTVKDSSGHALQNVIMTVGSRSTLTDDIGAYQLIGIPAGTTTVTAILSGYKTVTVTVAFAPGTQYLFSPTMYLSTVTPPATTVVGVLTDAVTTDPVAAASLTLNGTTQTTASDGKFAFGGLAPGAYQLSVSASGYQPATLSLTAVAGVNDLGSIPLQRTAATTTLHGHVLDAAGNPISSASIVVDNGPQTTSDDVGAYQIAGISGTRFTISIQATGFLAQSFVFSVSAPGDYAQDFQLVAQQVTNVTLGPLTVVPASGGANTSLGISSVLVNGGVAAFDGVLLLEVYDAENNRIGSGALTDPAGLSIGAVTLEPGESLGIAGRWNTGQFAPGEYTFELRLVETNSVTRSVPLGVLIQHQVANFDITSTSHFTGTVAADPPVIQAGLNQPVHFTGVIKNDGNVMFAPGPMTLTVSDTKTRAVAYSASADIDALSANGLADADFGFWTPAAGGNFSLTIAATDPTLGGISGSLYVGNVAQAAFTVNPDTVLAGTRSVHGNIHVSGVDPAQATVTDPLAPLIRTAIQNAISYNDTTAHTWIDVNRCTSCHISNQALIGGELTRKLTTFNALDRSTIINNVATNQAADGSITAGYSTSYHQRLGSLTLWGLLGYHDQPELQTVYKRAADWLVRFQSSSGEWVSDYKSAPPNAVTWFDNDISMSMLNLSNLRRTSELLRTNAIVSVPIYGVSAQVPAAPVSSRGFLTALPNGDLFYTDRSGPSANLIHPDGTLVTRWSKLGTVSISDPRSIVVRQDGQVWLSSSSGTLRLNADGTATKLSTDSMDSLAIDAAGTVWGIKVGDPHSIYQLDPVTAKATAWLANGPFGQSQLGRIVPGDDGTLYATDLIKGKIFQVMPDKSVTTVTEVIQGNQSIPNLLHLLKDGDHWLLSTPNGIVRLSADWIGQRITLSRADEMARMPDGSVVFVTSQKAGVQKLVPQQEAVGTSLTNYAAAINKGTNWLQAQTIAASDNMPTLHIAQKLWGLGEAYRYYKPLDASRAASIHTAMATLAAQLRANQAADGGWGTATTKASDALVTAQVGIALDYLDPSASDPAIRKAVAWLLTQQQGDGSWNSADRVMDTKVSTTTMVAIWLPMILDRLGAIDTEISVTFPRNVQPSMFQPAPSQTSTDALGNVTAQWSLVGVTNAGVDLGVDLALADMQADEVRPVATDAHMTFNNSFNAQTVTQPIPIPDVTAIAPVSLSVVTDHPDYPANATALVTTTLENLDDIDVDGTLVVNVYDHSGAFVGNVTQRSVRIPAASALPVTDPFFIGTIMPATYSVHAVLSNNGHVLALGETTFNVLPDNASASATSTVHTDKQVYNPSDHVQILSAVQSVTANATLADLSLQVKVFNAGNVVQYAHSYAIPQLMPGQVLDFTGVQTLSNAPPGLYAVKQDLFDSAGNLFNHVEAVYSVSSTSDTGFGLAGTIAAVPKSLRVGELLTLNAAATNHGNSALTNLPLTITVVDPVDGSVLQRFDQTSTLDVGASVPFVPTWITKGTPNKTYYAVLTARVGADAGARTLTLAIDTFELTFKGDVDLALKAVKPPLAALVLVDPDLPGAQITQVTSALASQHYATTIVSNGDAFSDGVRSGAYQLYLLLASHVMPDAGTLRLLREAVHRGDGLLSANGAAGLPVVLAEIAGLTAGDALPVINAQSLDVAASAPGGAAHADLVPAWPSRIVVPEVAQTLAVLTGRLPNVPEQGTLSDEVAKLGRVDIGYFGTDAASNGSQLTLLSPGRLRRTDGSDAASVWRVRNSADETRNVNLASVNGDYQLALKIGGHTDSFIASPVISGTADHVLSEATQIIQTGSAPANSFADSRLVDVNDNPGAIALWANEIGMSDVLDWTGSQHVVRGAVHSNSDIRLAGAQNIIDGPIHYVSTFINSGNQNTLTVQPRQVSTQPYPTLLNLDDFKPGAAISAASGSHYIDGSQECASSNHGWQRNGSQMPIASGVYWIPCDVHISGGNGTTSNVTLVSTGAMQIDGVKGMFQPYYAGLQFATTSQSAGALQLSGDATQIGGVVFAPNGTVKISGSSLNLRCSVIGNEIRFANAKTTIDARDCPYATVQRRSPAVLLNSFGGGWTAYSAFDWPGAMAKYEAGGSGVLTSLFGDVLSEIAPPQNPLRAGSVVPLSVTVQNLFDPFTGRLSLLADDDSTFVPPNTAWQLDFTQQAAAQAQSNVRLGSGNSTDVTASVSMTAPIVQDPLKQTTTTIAHLPGESIDALLSSMTAIADPDPALANAIAALQAASTAFAAGNRTGAVDHLLDAAEALGSSPNTQADALRTRIDWLIWANTH